MSVETLKVTAGVGKNFENNIEYTSDWHSWQLAAGASLPQTV